MNDSLASMTDLWVLPEPNLSRWFARLDWYLNFQMCKGLAYPGLHLPSETLSVALEHDLKVHDVELKPLSPLLVAGGGRVPAKFCAIIQGGDQLATWLKRVQATSEQILAKHVHVFLPKGTTVKEAQSLWDSENIMYTADLESLG